MGTMVRDLGATVHRARLAGVNQLALWSIRASDSASARNRTRRYWRGWAQLATLDLPIMVGPSRKAFLAQEDETGTKFATAAAVAAAILAGAHVVRVHDVAEMRAVAQIADEVLKGGASE